MSDESEMLHEPDCPLHEIGEHDCAYDLLLCTCGDTPETKP